MTDNAGVATAPPRRAARPEAEAGFFIAPSIRRRGGRPHHGGGGGHGGRAEHVQPTPASRAPRARTGRRRGTLRAAPPGRAPGTARRPRGGHGVQGEAQRDQQAEEGEQQVRVELGHRRNRGQPRGVGVARVRAGGGHDVPASSSAASTADSARQPAHRRGTAVAGRAGRPAPAGSSTASHTSTIDTRKCAATVHQRQAGQHRDAADTACATPERHGRTQQPAAAPGRVPSAAITHGQCDARPAN